MSSTSSTSSSLQGLPPLPKSLHGLLSAGSAHWKETEKIHNVKSSIQKDIPKTNTIKRPNLVVQNGVICFLENDTTGQKERKEEKAGKIPGNNNKHSLESAIAFLRHEMVALRQMDSSLLCQLMSLNESVQEFKNALLHGDRFSETNSTCSSRSLDQGLDGIVEEESDYENYAFHMMGNGPRIYENIEFVSGGGRLSGRSGSGSVRSSRIQEQPEDAEDYLEPQSWKDGADKAVLDPLQPRKAPPLWNLPPQLSLELLSLPPPPPLPLSSPPHSPPIPASPQHTLLSPNDSSASLSSRSSGSSIKARSGGAQQRSPGTPKDNKWPGYLLLNSSTSFESAC